MKVGDTVRENWSGFYGTIVWVKDKEAGVKYPTGRILKSHLSWLVKKP